MTIQQQAARVVSASREIAAGPGQIFELIADPAQQPSWDGNDNLAAARRGEGPAVLSALAVAQDVEAGRLVQVPTEEVDLSQALRAVWPAGRPLAPLARRLLNLAGHEH